MFMMRQGDISNAKRVDELEKRVEMLENVVKQLQEKNARIGRPPKEKANGQKTIGSLSNSE
jgi:phage terminase large subunit-like protein